MREIRVGQGLLVVCCIFYLLWWMSAFRPDRSGTHIAGKDAALFAVTAVSGMAGLYVNLSGIVSGRYGKGFIDGRLILLSGILAYIILLAVTERLLHRAVTTELLLIVGWTMLEIASVNAAYAFDALSPAGTAIMLLVTATAAIASLAFYLAYYNVEPMTGYYFGMIPLVTEAAAMLLFELFSSMA